MPESLIQALDGVDAARRALAHAELVLHGQIACEMLRTRTFGLSEEHVRRNRK